jgi:small subunit ribosomal protein S17e
LGKVRTETVKKAAMELLKRYPDKFAADYEANKSVVAQLVSVHSKRIRNRIAGYVTALKKIEERKEAVATPSPVEEAETK